MGIKKDNGIIRHYNINNNNIICNITSQYGSAKLLKSKELLNDNLVKFNLLHDNIQIISSQNSIQIGSAIKKNEQQVYDKVYKDGIFDSSFKIYFVADATDEKLIKNYFARLKKLKINKNEFKNIRPHITMMEIHVNRLNKDHKYIVDSYGQINNILRDLLLQKYQQISPQMYLKSKEGKYEIMGEFVAKIYKLNDPIYITKFRMILYSYLEMMLGKSTKIIKTDQNNKVYYIYSYNGKELMAVPDYYHGEGIWTPHLSLIKLSKLQNSNNKLYLLFQKNGLSAIIDALKGVPGKMDDLNMSYHFSSFRISVRQF